MCRSSGLAARSAAESRRAPIQRMADRVSGWFVPIVILIALVFLYFIAAIFVYGGELNASIVKWQNAASPEEAPSPARAG